MLNIPPRKMVGIVCFIAALTFSVFLNLKYRWIQDDAYITFRYAKNWVNGFGIVYNPGERLEGYTNFLWMVISAVPQTFGVTDPMDFMHFLGAGLLLLSYIMFFSVIFIVFQGNFALAVAATVPVTFFWSYNLWFLSGMETALISFLISAGVLCFVIPKPTLLGIVCGLLILTRMDQIFVVAALLGLHLWNERKNSISWVRLARPVICCGIIVIPYLVWKWFYYGDIFPNTYYIKMADHTFYERGWSYFFTFTQVYPVKIGVVSVLLAAYKNSGRSRNIFICVFAIFAAHSFYLIRLGGDFMEWRFLVPVAAPLIAATVPAIWTVFETREKYRLLVTAIAFSFFSFLMIRGTEKAKDHVINGQETIQSLARYSSVDYDWRLMGQIIKREFPQGTKIATSAAGMLPFYCDCYVLDMHGLNDPLARFEVAKMSGRGRVGHEYALLDPARLAARGAQVVIHWPDLFFTYSAEALRFIPTNNFEKVSINTGNGRYLNVLMLDPALTTALRQKNSKFYTFGDDLAGRRSVALEKPTIQSEGTAWNCAECIVILRRLELNLTMPLSFPAEINMAFDHNDSYKIEFYSGKKMLEEVHVGPNITPAGGMHVYVLKPTMRNGSADRIIIAPTSGDGLYSFGGLRVR